MLGKLTNAERATVMQVASMRLSAFELNGFQEDEAGARRDHYHDHILGASGEMAVAKAFNFYWDFSVNKFSAGGDVAELQVRTTRNLDAPGRMVEPHDKDDALFVLVSGRPGGDAFTLRGYTRGIDAKQERWFRSIKAGRKPKYFVPADELRDVEELVS